MRNYQFNISNIKENVGGTTYFYAQEQARVADYEEEAVVPYPITPGHAYSTPSHLSSDEKQSNHQSSVFFMADDLRNSILLKNELSNTTNVETENLNLPLEVDSFHSISLIETSNLPVPTSSTYIGMNSHISIIHFYILHFTMLNFSYARIDRN